MQIDFSTVLRALDGNPLREGNRDVTLGMVAVNCLLMNFPDEVKLSGEDKFKRGKLAERIYEKADVEITVEEAALMKMLIGKGGATWVVTQAYSAIEAARTATP